MFRTTRTRIVGLALLGVVALGGTIYATATLAGGDATAAPATATQAVTDQQIRASILDMLEDHMRLTGPDAERLADQMIARMQNLDGDFDLQGMIDWCSGYTANGTQGRGMMGGYGNGAQGGGMMGGYGMMGR